PASRHAAAKDSPGRTLEQASREMSVMLEPSGFPNLATNTMVPATGRRRCTGALDGSVTKVDSRRAIKDLSRIADQPWRPKVNNFVAGLLAEPDTTNVLFAHATSGGEYGRYCRNPNRHSPRQRVESQSGRADSAQGSVRHPD